MQIVRQRTQQQRPVDSLIIGTRPITCRNNRVTIMRNLAEQKKVNTQQVFFSTPARHAFKFCVCAGNNESSAKKMLMEKLRYAGCLIIKKHR
jgi:hypothetical protein